MDNSNNNYQTNKDSSLNLASISYADFILLSSTLSFAIAEELQDEDLDILIAFFGMIVSDLAILRTKRGILNARQAQNNEENIAGSESASNAGAVIAGTLSRKSKKKKCIRKVKRKVRKKKSET